MTTNTTAAQVLKIAKDEVGYHEQYKNGHWDNFQKYSPAVPGLEWSQSQAWCATFVSWCFLKAGMVHNAYPTTASVWSAMQWWKAQKRWSEYPAVGAQVIFGTDGSSHTGLVYAYDADYIYTYEGNTNDSGSAEGDGVYKKKRARRSDYVHGYGYPDYKGGIVSADPKWAPPAPPKAPAKPTTPAKPTAPAKPAPAKYSPPKFPAGIAPNKNVPTARTLQSALKKTGWMAKNVTLSDNYGPKTQAAVAGFNKKHNLNDAGKSYDPAIGPKGWALLFTLAYGS